MAGLRRYRRSTILASAAVLAVLANCTGVAAPEPAATPPGPTLPSAAVGFPIRSQEYAEAAVIAVAAPDLRRLAELVTPQVRRELINLPGPPDPRWTFLDCQSDDRSSDCSFYNVDGDQLTVRVLHSKLGGPQAATAVEFAATVYPTDGPAYVTEFVTAWQVGNLARMDVLARPAVVSLFHQLPASPVAGYDELAGSADRCLVRVATAGQTMLLYVSEGRLGEPQAIVHAAVEPK